MNMRKISIRILNIVSNLPLLDSYMSHYNTLGYSCLRFHNTVRPNITVLKRRFLFNSRIIIYMTFLHLCAAYSRRARDTWQRLSNIFAISVQPF